MSTIENSAENPAIETARTALAAAEIAEEKAAQRVRETSNVYLLKQEAAVCLAPDQRHELAAAEKECGAALEDYEKCKKRVLCAHVDLETADKHAAALSKLPSIIYPTADEREAHLQQARADWNAARKERERLEAIHNDYSVEVPKIEEERVAVLQSNRSLESQAAALAHLPIKRELLTAKLNESSEALAQAYAVEAAAAKLVVGQLNQRFAPIDERVSSVYASFRAVVALMPIGEILGHLRNKQAGVGGAPVQYVRSAADWAAAVEVLGPEIDRQCEGLEAACEDLRERFAKLRGQAEKALAKLSEGGRK